MKLFENYYQALGVQPHACQEILDAAIEPFLNELDIRNIDQNEPNYNNYMVVHEYLINAYEALNDPELRSIHDTYILTTGSADFTNSIGLPMDASAHDLVRTCTQLTSYLSVHLPEIVRAHPTVSKNFQRRIDQITSIQYQYLTTVDDEQLELFFIKAIQDNDLAGVKLMLKIKRVEEYEEHLLQNKNSLLQLACEQKNPVLVGYILDLRRTVAPITYAEWTQNDNVSPFANLIILGNVELLMKNVKPPMLEALLPTLFYYNGEKISYLELAAKYFNKILFTVMVTICQKLPPELFVRIINNEISKSLDKINFSLLRAIYERAPLIFLDIFKNSTDEVFFEFLSHVRPLSFIANIVEAQQLPILQRLSSLHVSIDDYDHENVMIKIYSSLLNPAAEYLKQLALLNIKPTLATMIGLIKESNFDAAIMLLEFPEFAADNLDDMDQATIFCVLLRRLFKACLSSSSSDCPEFDAPILDMVLKKYQDLFLKRDDSNDNCFHYLVEVGPKFADRKDLVSIEQRSKIYFQKLRNLIEKSCQDATAAKTLISSLLTFQNSDGLSPIESAIDKKDYLFLSSFADCYDVTNCIDGRGLIELIGKNDQQLSEEPADLRTLKFEHFVYKAVHFAKQKNKRITKSSASDKPAKSSTRDKSVSILHKHRSSFIAKFPTDSTEGDDSDVSHFDESATAKRQKP